jgi:Vitamin K-dependent gamma-carboxylase
MTTFAASTSQPSALARCAQNWNRFWFTPADPTSLGLIRICAGLIVLYAHLCYSFDLQTFFGKYAWIGADRMEDIRKNYPFAEPARWDKPPFDTAPLTVAQRADLEKWGPDPRHLVARGHKQMWSVWFHVTDPTTMWLVHAGFLVCMLSFTMGFCTRITSVLTWIGMLSYIHRARTSLFGMDAIMTFAVLYLMIGPSGAALSLDRLIHRYWATREARRKGEPAPPLSRPDPSVSANIALRLLQIHLCIVYLMSGLSKLQGAMWWNGTAVWGTMANYEFSPMQLKIYMAWLRFLASHIWLWELVTTAGTYFTLAFEISFAFLVWNRQTRWLMLTCVVLMHVGIAFCMGLTTFSMIMMTVALAFVPADTIRQLLSQFGRRSAGPRLAQLEAA